MKIDLSHHLLEMSDLSHHLLEMSDLSHHLLEMSDLSHHLLEMSEVECVKGHSHLMQVKTHIRHLLSVLLTVNFVKLSIRSHFCP